MKYRKIIFFVIVIIVIYLIYYLYHDKTISYIALGDTFALGENPYGEIVSGYPDFLINDLEKNKNIRLYTKDFSNKNYHIRDLEEDVIFNKNILIDGKTLSLKSALRDANFITLSIGANDVISDLSFNEINKLSNNEIVTNVGNKLKKLLDEIMKYNKNIILVGYYDLYLNKEENNIFDLLNDEYKKIAKEVGITYIDTYKIIKEKYLENPQSFYPNQSGYRLISKEILNLINKKT